jgi:hypothetical protein
MGTFFDVEVRDLDMAIAAYALAKLTEARATATEIQPMLAPGLGRMTA